MDDNHKHCYMRQTVCTCGYENELERNVERLEAVEIAVKRLAYIVRKSVNSGPLSNDPTQEAEAWRQVRIALGEGYDDRGNLVTVGAKNGR